MPIYLPTSFTDPLKNWINTNINLEATIDNDPNNADDTYIWTTVDHGLSPDGQGKCLSLHLMDQYRDKALEERLREHNFPFRKINQIITRYCNTFALPADVQPDYNLGVFIAYSFDGHKVHTHTDEPDTTDDNMTMCRLNVLLQKSESGGDVVMGGEVHQFDENQVWLCEANKCEHGSTATVGAGRIILSIGFTLDPEHTNKIRETLAN